MATHSSVLAWEIPWMEEPGRTQSMGLQRVRHNWATNTLYTVCDIISLQMRKLISREFNAPTPQGHTASSGERIWTSPDCRDYPLSTFLITTLHSLLPEPQFAVFLLPWHFSYPHRAIVFLERKDGFSTTQIGKPGWGKGWLREQPASSPLGIHFLHWWSNVLWSALAGLQTDSWWLSPGREVQTWSWSVRGGGGGQYKVLGSGTWRMKTWEAFFFQPCFSGDWSPKRTHLVTEVHRGTYCLWLHSSSSSDEDGWVIIWTPRKFSLSTGVLSLQWYLHFSSSPLLPLPPVFLTFLPTPTKGSWMGFHHWYWWIFF